MASVTTKLNDEELRARLLKLGLNPGPITDTTRPLYLSKLRALSSSGAALTASNGSHPPSDGRTRKGWHKGQLPQRKPPAPPQDRVRHPNAHVPANPSSRPRPVQVVPAVQQLSSPGHGSAPRASYSPATVSPSQAGREGGAQGTFLEPHTNDWRESNEVSIIGIQLGGSEELCISPYISGYFP